MTKRLQSCNDPVQMRKIMVATQVMQAARMLFVPMPVHSIEEFVEKMAEYERRISDELAIAEAEESNQNDNK